MGTKTYVSSSVISLNGDYDPEATFVKTSLISAVLDKNSNRTFLGESLTNSYLNGPGIRSRQYFKWSKNNFSLGQTSGSILSYSDINPSSVATHITSATDETVVISRVIIKPADFFYYAEKYVSENYQYLYTTGWTADFDGTVVTIQFEDNTTTTFNLNSFNVDSDYIIAYYTLVKDDYTDPVIEGNIYSSNPTDLTNYTQISSQDTPVSETLTETITETIVYSNGSPDEVTTTSSDSISTPVNNHTISTYDEYEGTDGVNNRVVTTSYIHNSWTKYNIITNTDTETITRYYFTDASGNTTEVTSTDTYTYTTDTTTVTETEVIDFYNEYRDDTQKTYSRELNGGYKVFIYEVGGSNTALNNLVISNTSTSSFYPFIPLRIDNKAINDTNHYSDFVYNNCKKAFKKASGSNNFSNILDDIEENPDIDDIDFVYMVSGIPLNTDNDSAKQYLYKVFDKLFAQQNSDVVAYSDWKTATEFASDDFRDLLDWEIAQEEGPSNPLHGTRPPDPSGIGALQSNAILISGTSNLTLNFDFRISWANIDKQILTGLAKPNAKVNDVFIEKAGSFTYNTGITGSTLKELSTSTIDAINVYKQIGPNTYVLFVIEGLEHKNYVYNNTSVDISAHEALDDNDPSGFIFPLDNEIVKDMSLVHSTEMMSSANYLVFNSYEIVKKKWYQSGIFAIFVVIVIIVIAVYTGYIDPASLSGILGSSAGVGATLGLSGLTGLLVGIGLNTVAATLLLKILSAVAVEVFGEQIGMIIAMIATIALSGGFDSSNFSSSLPNWGKMMTADNLLQLTNVIGNVTQAWIAGDTASVLQELDELQKEAQEKQDELDELIKELNGSSGIFDPIALTDIGFNSQFTNESIDVFLQRTLMTGGDIVELSLSMINDFTELTLTLPNR